VDMLRRKKGQNSSTELGESAMTPLQETTTQKLLDASNAHQQALDDLMPLLYDELRRLAGRYLCTEPSPRRPTSGRR